MSDSIQTVHIVFKTHLDVGFTDFARTITADYFERYIPSAIQLARRLKQEREHERFVWTTGSWLIYEYLERANAEQRKLLEDAILEGDIVWHGLPFTTHTELMDVPLFRFGLSLSQALDKRFGRKTVSAKMTDVPGHTRGIVPLMAEAGLQFLHLGANQASTPPDVPPVFRWEVGDSDLMVMYQRGGYGDAMSVPGLGEALAFAHTNDNHGPQTFEGVLQAYEEMHKRFPLADLVASTMDAFAEQLWQVKYTLPLITDEMGDTWIQGVGSDPTKINQYRELLRLRNQWLAEKTVQPDDKAFSSFSRSLMMIPEHTWGMDEKVHLKDYTNYDAEHFKAARQEPHFQKFESSWTEQRAYLKDAVDALDGTDLRQEAVQHLNDIKPQRPVTRAYQRVENPGSRFETAHFTVAFDPRTAALVQLTDRTGRKWASPKNPLGLFSYQTFSKADYDSYWQHYIINKRETKIWSLPDNTKIGIEQAAPEGRIWQSTQTELFTRQTKHEQSFLLTLHLDPETSQRYGGPRVVTLEVTFPQARPEVHFNLQWFEKPACRLPEAFWFSFNPRVKQPRNWQMEKLGQWISPLDVIRNGNRKLHAVGEGLRNHDETARLNLQSLDAVLVAPGEPSLLNFNNRQPPLEKGMHFNLYNNVWATNFPMWYEDDVHFRFILSLAAVT